ncbi:hypothetical protein JCM10207_003265 [Rhodosporidiobolus poonsookiae]
MLILCLSTVRRWLAALSREENAPQLFSQLAEEGYPANSPLSNSDGSLVMYEVVNILGDPTQAFPASAIRRVMRAASPTVSHDALKTAWKKTGMFSLPPSIGKKVVMSDEADWDRWCTDLHRQRVENRAERRRTAKLAADGAPASPALPSVKGDSTATPVKAAPETPVKRKRQRELARVEQPPIKRSASDSSVSSQLAKLEVASRSASPAHAVTPAPSKPLSPSQAASPALPPSTTEPTTSEAAIAIAEAKLAARKQFELSSLRHVYSVAQRKGGAAFVALDVEFWERDHSVLLEFGWSVSEFIRDEDGKVKTRREVQHVVIKENAKWRNGRYAPDARDHFDFGRTLTLPQDTLHTLLSALLSTLSATQPVYLVFHDPRGDLRALTQLGFDPSTEFEREGDLHRIAEDGGQRGLEPGRIWITDTQRLFSAWLGRKNQVGLEKACDEFKVPTRRLHNAANDAHYTLALFERLMNAGLRPSPKSKLIEDLDARAAEALRRKAEQRAQQ